MDAFKFELRPSLSLGDLRKNIAAVDLFQKRNNITKLSIFKNHPLFSKILSEKGIQRNEQQHCSKQTEKPLKIRIILFSFSV